MKIVFNPESPAGSDIKGFMVKDYGLIDDHLAGQLKQYQDYVADSLLVQFEFLSEVDAEKAKQIKESIGKTLKCDYPKCDFSTETPIALSGHKRSHDKTVDNSELLVDISIAPLAGSRPVHRAPTESEARNSRWDGSIANGRDADGVEWYGEGLTNDSMEIGPVVGDAGVFGG